MGQTVDRHASPAEGIFFLILVPNSLFRFLLFNPFIASGARKVYIRKPTLQLRTSCAGALHCRSPPTCAFISCVHALDSHSDCTAPKQSCNRTLKSERTLRLTYSTTPFSCLLPTPLRRRSPSSSCAAWRWWSCWRSAPDSTSTAPSGCAPRTPWSSTPRSTTRT